MLTREQILNADDMQHVDVEVPEWGGSVRVRTISGRERQRFQKMAQVDGETAEDFMEKLIVASACDEAGNPLFTVEDVKALSEKSAIPLERVFGEVARLNGLTQESRDEIKGE